MSSGFLTKSFTFDPRPSYPLLSVVKRYWKEDSASINDPDALTLIFAHGTGFHKEQWEPVIDDLQAILDTDYTNTKVREIWTIDAPNHGDAAALNEGTLKLGYDYIFGWEEYARSIHLFLSGLGTGVDNDFTGHKLVGIGHSMGAVSLHVFALSALHHDLTTENRALSLGYYPKVKFASLVLCEVMIMPAEFGAVAKDMLVNGAVNRRDTWPSRNEAYNILKSRGSWKTWDERVLKIYVESGMRLLPTATYPDQRDGVTLKCTRLQEAACYRDGIGSRRVYHNFENIVKQVPTHLIYGEIDDYLPEAVKEDVKAKAGGIDKLMSFSRVPGAGHLVPQMNPSGLAAKIYEALSLTSRITEIKKGKL